MDGCVCVHMTASGLSIQNRPSDSLKLKLQEVASCLVGAGNQTSAPLQEWYALLTTDPSLQSYAWNL